MSFWRKVRRRKKQPFFSKTIIVEQVPNKLEKKVIYYSRKARCISFLCPCGCKIKQSFFVSESNKADGKNMVWGSEFDSFGQLTITPSIWQKTKCQSHYFITKNDVEWS